MKDDIETPTEAGKVMGGAALSALELIIADRDRLQGRVGTLQNALDDRYAADQRAAKAIFAETGRTSGFPSVKEVVAYYMAEVERLEKERDTMLDDIRELDAVCSVLGCEDSLEPVSEYARSALDEVDHLRAKLDSAKEALTETRRLVSQCAMHGFVGEAPLQELFVNNGKISAVLSKISADAPAQQTQISDEAIEAGAKAAFCTMKSIMHDHDDHWKAERQLRGSVWIDVAHAVITAAIEWRK